MAERMARGQGGRGQRGRRRGEGRGRAGRGGEGRVPSVRDGDSGLVPSRSLRSQWVALRGDRGRPWADRTLSPCLTVSLFLHAWPNPVFEGESLTLRCQGRNVALFHVNFYKDGKVLRFSQNNQPLIMGMVTASSSGQYSCSAKTTFLLPVDRKVSETTTVQVRGESPAGGWADSEVSSSPGSAPLWPHVRDAVHTPCTHRAHPGWGTKCPEPALLLTPAETLGQTLPLWGPDDPVAFWDSRGSDCVGIVSEPGPGDNDSVPLSLPGPPS